MLDFSFGEILVIAIIAVIFLGPDKLPQTFVKIAKFLRAVKKTINDAKDTLDREIHITEMKQDALEYKKKFEDSALKLKDDILADLEPTKTKLQSELEGLKSEIDSLKIADKLNEPLEKSSVKNLTFDEVESKGQALQNRLKRNLKTKDLGESKSTKTRIAKVSGESSAKKTSVSKATKKVTKSTKASESKKVSKKSVKDSADSADSKQKKRKSKSKKVESKKAKKSKDESK